MNQTEDHSIAVEHSSTVFFIGEEKNEQFLNENHEDDTLDFGIQTTVPNLLTLVGICTVVKGSKV